jgi:UDP-N-acetylmuramate dehydrogenase
MSLKVEENVPLAPLTTFEIGGPARYFVEAESEADVIAAFDLAAEKDLPVLVLGGGSNVLVSDAGFEGLVIRISLRGVHLDGDVVTAAAGEDWDALVEYCVSRDLAGVECMSGIPGSVGGTPVQNVGAYGQEVSETILCVHCLDRRKNEIVELSNLECRFEYRKSIFNTTDRERFVVLAVRYQLVEGGPPKIEYRDLKDYFGDRTPTLAETRRAVLDIRRRKSMVIDPGDPNSRSAGSFFKNPVVDAGELGRISEAAGGADVPNFPAGGGTVKVPAAWLIERAGFQKGFRHGNAGISENHSLALVNRGGATAAEDVGLMEMIRAGVGEKFGIRLLPEPIFVGFETRVEE